MPTTYRPVEDGTSKLIAEIMKRHHRDLARCGVTVGAVYAVADPEAEDQRPVKVGRYPCYALIRIVPERDRAMGMPDAQIVIDEGVYGGLTPDQRAALIDHELYHLETQHDSEGVLKFDGMQRPKLANRLHDWQIGGFRAIAERHRENAIEVIEAEKVRHTFGETLFDLAASAAGA